MAYHLTPLGRTALRRSKTAYPRFNGCESGFRFFSPGLGRWASRDPVAESGGVNRYAFVQNTPIFLLDPLGQAGIAIPTIGEICAEILAGVTLPEWGPWVAAGTLIAGGVTYLVYTRTGTYTETYDVYRERDCQCMNTGVNSVPQTVTQTKTVPHLPFCLPCIPLAGYTMNRTCFVAGHGCPGTHTHHAYVVQLPVTHPTEPCACKRQSLALDVTCGDTPWPGEGPWVEPILGGGVAP